MKILLWIIAGIIFVPSAIYFITVSEMSPFHEYFEYRRIKKMRASFESIHYLQKYPNGKYIKEVKEITDSLEFLEAKDAAEKGDYFKIKRYVTVNDKTHRYKRAIKIADECLYKNFFKDYNFSLLLEYLNDVPESALAEKLQEMKDILVAQAIVIHEKKNKDTVLNPSSVSFYKYLLDIFKNTKEPQKIYLRFISRYEMANLNTVEQFETELYEDELFAKGFKPEIVSKPILKKVIQNKLIPILSKKEYELLICSLFQKSLDELMPASGVFKVLSADSIQNDNHATVFQFEYTIKNVISKSKSIPVICEIYDEIEGKRKETKTERVSRYNHVLKRRIYEDVKKTTYVTDNSLTKYISKGYCFLLNFDLKCAITIPEKVNNLTISYNYTPKFVMKSDYDDEFQNRAIESVMNGFTLAFAKNIGVDLVIKK